MSTHYPTAADGREAGTRSGRSGMAVASLVLGILAIPGVIIPFVGIVLGGLALGLGLAARKQGGGGQAMAGIVLGAIALVVALAIIAIAVAGSGS